MRMRRKHVLGATVAAVAAAGVAAGTGFGFADTAPARQSACSGSVTFSAEGGAPAATSNRFPVGTRLRVTNLDNGKAATVTVTGPSGSCVLLNTAAMDLIREPGKNVVRRNLVERLDAAAAQPAQPARPGAGEIRPGNAQPGAARPGGAAQGGAAQGGAAQGGAAQGGAAQAGGDAQPGGAGGRTVCGGPVTFSGEAGAPAATSGQFPVGTRLRVTNLDNGRAVTVTVTGTSGSCVLLNTAAMDQIREPGKNVVRRNVVELLG